MKYNFAVFACGDVGIASVRLFREQKDRLRLVVLDSADFWNKNKNILQELQTYTNTRVIFYTNDNELKKELYGIDAVILAYWGRLIKDSLLGIPRYGYINLHTSYLPFGKGKHSHFWSIVEDTPYGVSIMKIDAGLDTGEIIYQREISKSWLDTGKSLYFKGIQAMEELLEEKKEALLNLDFTLKQQTEKGTFHFGREIEERSQIYLDRKYTAKELLNILRARTFAPFPAAYFIEDGQRYEVRINISKVQKPFDSKEVDYEKIREAEK